MDKETSTARKNFIRTVTTHFKSPLDDSILQLTKIKNTYIDDKKLSQSILDVEYKLSKIQNDMTNLVLLSSLTCDTYTQEISTIQPLTLFEDLSKLWITNAKAKGLSSYIFIDPSLPISLDIDENSLRHTLSQLMDNAIKFTPKGGCIYLDIRKILINKKEHISFSVTDTGIGIVKAKIPKLIQPFALPSNTGVGLGLSSSFYLLRKIGSNLQISSEVSKGSRFSFTLPFTSKEKRSVIEEKSLFIGIFEDDDTMQDYTRQLFSYLMAMGMELISIDGVDDPKLAKCQALFIIDRKFDRNKKNLILKNYPSCVVIPTFLEQYDKAYDISKKFKDYKLLLPLFPSAIISTFKYIKQELAFTQQRDKEKQTPNETPKKLKELNETRPLKILLVEDVAINIKWTLMLLERYKHNITFSENGEIAVAMAKEHRYDLILMDIDMPIMNGIEATQHIKAYEKEVKLPHTPIVALTSHDQEGEKEEILAQGLDEFLAKPLKLSELESIFKKYDPKNRSIQL